VQHSLFQLTSEKVSDPACLFNTTIPWLLATAKTDSKTKCSKQQYLKPIFKTCVFKVFSDICRINSKTLPPCMSTPWIRNE